MKLKKFMGTLALLVLSACGPAQESEKIQVVTTLFPTYDFARTLAGDLAEVTLLLPPGVESHSYEPTPGDLVKISEAGLFIYTSQAMEPWASKVASQAASSGAKVLEAASTVPMVKEEHDHDHHQEGSGHPWEWAGSFFLEKGEYRWSFSQVEGAYADPGMVLAVVPLKESGIQGLEAGEASAEKLFQGTPVLLKGSTLHLAAQGLYSLAFNQDASVTVFTLKVDKPGNYGFFTEHLPTEFEAGEHYLKDSQGAEVEPQAQEPEGADHHHHGGVDPHVWLDPTLAVLMAAEIETALVSLLPSGAEEIHRRAEGLKAQLLALDQAYGAAAKNFRNRTIVYGGHFAFGYLARRYGLEHVSPYAGFSPDTEPTPGRIAELVDVLKKTGSQVIFYEELLDPKVARVISEQTGARMELLHGAHNLSLEERAQGLTYVRIMEDNLKKLTAALGSQ